MFGLAHSCVRRAGGRLFDIRRRWAGAARLGACAPDWPRSQESVCVCVCVCVCVRARWTRAAWRARRKVVSLFALTQLASKRPSRQNCFILRAQFCKRVKSLQQVACAPMPIDWAAEKWRRSSCAPAGQWSGGGFDCRGCRIKRRRKRKLARVCSKRKVILLRRRRQVAKVNIGAAQVGPATRASPTSGRHFFLLFS